MKDDPLSGGDLIEDGLTVYTALRRRCMGFGLMARKGSFENLDRNGKIISVSFASDISTTWNYGISSCRI
jgi:hypothetical protein